MLEFIHSLDGENALGLGKGSAGQCASPSTPRGEARYLTYFFRFAMATLTLKKAPKILSKPLEELKGKYAVMRQHENHKSMRFTCFHESQESATKEARRLQEDKIHSPARYLVVKIVDHVGL